MKDQQEKCDHVWEDKYGTYKCLKCGYEIDEEDLHKEKPAASSEGSEQFKAILIDFIKWSYRADPEYAERIYNKYIVAMKKKVEANAPTESKPTIEGHCELPNGNYKYGEPYNSGVRPVYGAHQQLLWYSVPNRSTRFADLQEAEDIQFTRLELADLRAERNNVLKLANDRNEELIKLHTKVENSVIAISFADKQISELKAENEQLRKFKEYVHKRLDDAGISVDPESPHKAAGCRIGGRLDIVLQKEDSEGRQENILLKAENEQLKQTIMVIANHNRWVFTTELERRWPSREQLLWMWKGGTFEFAQLIKSHLTKQ